MSILAGKRETFSPILLFFLIFVLLFITYAPALLMTYAHNDDYGHFWRFERAEFRDPQIFLNFYLEPYNRVGRFFEMVLRIFYEGVVHSVADLVILRFLSVLNLSICASFIFKWIRPWFGSSLPAFFAAGLIFTLPPFEVLASYSNMTYAAQGMTFAALAAILARQYAQSGERPVNARTIGAIVLLLLAIMTYQPAGMFYWVFVGIFILSPENRRENDFYRRFIKLFLVGLSGIGLYAVIIKLLTGSVVSTIYHYYSPVYIATNYWEKLKWFFAMPLRDSLNLWDVFPNTGQAWLAAAVIVLTSLVSFYRPASERGIHRRMFTAAAFGILILLSFLPNLLVVHDFPWYRSCLALSPLVALAILWTLRYWIFTVCKRQPEKVLTAILAVSCLWGMVAAYRNVLYYRVLPSALEYEYFKATLGRSDLTNFSTVYFIPLKQPLAGPHFRYDEFGVLSTNYNRKSHYPSILKCILREVGFKANLVPDLGIEGTAIIKFSHKNQRHDHYLRVNFEDGELPAYFGPETLVVDMTKLSRDKKILSLFPRHEQ